MDYEALMVNSSVVDCMLQKIVEAGSIESSLSYHSIRSYVLKVLSLKS